MKYKIIPHEGEDGVFCIHSADDEDQHIGHAQKIAERRYIVTLEDDDHWAFLVLVPPSDVGELEMLAEAVAESVERAKNLDPAKELEAAKKLAEALVGEAQVRSDDESERMTMGAIERMHHDAAMATFHAMEDENQGHRYVLTLASPIAKMIYALSEGDRTKAVGLTASFSMLLLSVVRTEILGGEPPAAAPAEAPAAAPAEAPAAPAEAPAAAPAEVPPPPRKPDPHLH